MDEYTYRDKHDEWGSLLSRELWQKRAELEMEVHERVLARTKRVTALEKELREAQAREQKLLDDLQGVAWENKELEEKNERFYEENVRLACLSRDLEAENFELKRPWFERVWFSLVDRIPFRIVWR